MHMLLYGGQLNIQSGASTLFHEIEFRGGAAATYFPVNQTAAIGLIPVGRSDHSAVNVGMNTMLVFGGKTDTTVLNELWSFDLLSKVWFQKNPSGTAPLARGGHRAVLIDSKMYIFGGVSGSNYYDDVVIYDIINNAWIQTVTPQIRPTARYGHSMVAYLNRGFFMFGGQDLGGLSNEVWYYDVAVNTWELQVINRSVSLPPTERVDHTAVLARGSRYMIVFGGLDGQYTQDLWIYDVECKTWAEMTPQGTRPSARGRHSAIIYNDNEMYIFGGRDATQITRTMHRYTVPLAPPYGYCPVKLNIVNPNSASVATFGFMLFAILVALM
jgi:hypothetical protein